MLNLSGKKILLSIHILLVGIWFGVCLGILAVLIFKPTIAGIGDYHILDKTIFYLFDTVVMNITIAVALTGLIFSMFTPWGFFRFHWIIVKWVAIILLAGIIIFLESPSINGMAAVSDIFREEIQNHPEYNGFVEGSFLYSSIQLFLLILIVIISVFKPWGHRKSTKVRKRKLIVSLGVVVGILLIVSMTVQYLQLEHYRKITIKDVDLKVVKDGYYVGSADFYFPYEVGIQIEDHQIKKIKILNNRSSFYARLAEGITYKIVREQKINLDAVSGATTTSKALMKAVESALHTGYSDGNKNQ
ncbi:MAG: FMN-binding protein [bacterium]|nr:MAG: FMN-binding protein [bacterium]